MTRKQRHQSNIERSLTFSGVFPPWRFIVCGHTAQLLRQTWNVFPEALERGLPPPRESNGRSKDARLVECSVCVVVQVYSVLNRIDMKTTSTRTITPRTRTVTLTPPRTDKTNDTNDNINLQFTAYILHLTTNNIHCTTYILFATNTYKRRTPRCVSI